MPTNELEINQEAYRRLRGQIDATYPKGRFVAISQGKIVGDAATSELGRVDVASLAEAWFSVVSAAQRRPQARTRLPNLVISTDSEV